MSLAQKKEIDLPGVTSPYVNIGAYGSPFALRTEHHNLGSIHYVHEGEPQEWYNMIFNSLHSLPWTGQANYTIG